MQAGSRILPEALDVLLYLAGQLRLEGVLEGCKRMALKFGRALTLLI